MVICNDNTEGKNWHIDSEDVKPPCTAGPGIPVPRDTLVPFALYLSITYL